jgi:alpha-amylase
MRSKLQLMAVIAALIFSSCQNKTETKPVDDSAKINGHPAWINQGNIYEVNVRQYTPEGTFKAFEKHLDRLKEMGVQTLWFMPINPISKVDRKGALGSYYAVQSYVDINPEFGTMEDWRALVKHCHELGLKVIIDWVPNHTGADHKWLVERPDFYERDSATGKFLSPFDWTDTRKLNYKNQALQDTMINQMKFWIDSSNIDGFRCDVAGEVPDAFWNKCISTLKKQKNIFMLAEGDRKGLHEAGFDATYAWADFAMMKKVAKGERMAKALDSVLNNSDTIYPANYMRMFFTSNHDENTWNKADYATMPGASHAPFAVLTQTIKSNVPLIYSGQEEPFLDSLSFFYKDTLFFGKFERASLYKTLLNLRKNNAALGADASFKKIVVGDEDALYAYVKEKDKSKVLVILNLSNKQQSISVKDASLHGKPYNVFMGTAEPLTDKPWNIEPWGYVIYEYK